MSAATLQQATQARELLYPAGSSEFWLLLLFVMQATMWELVTPSGSAPSARYSHVAAWSDAANGMYIHGGMYIHEFDGYSAGAREVSFVFRTDDLRP